MPNLKPDQTPRRADGAPPTPTTGGQPPLPGPTASPVTVALTGKPAPHGKPAPYGNADVPIACTLSPDQAEERVEEWRRLLRDQPGVTSAVTARHATADGIRLEFDDTVDVVALVGLAQAEYDCCRFFGFAITIDQRGIGLDITAPADARPVLEALFGPN